MDSRDILASNRNDIDKLLDIFELQKESIKIDYPELYYALLAVKDDIKLKKLIY